MSEGKPADITIAKELVLPKGSVLIADRAKVGFKWLHVLDSSGIFFVTRLKKNVQTQALDNYSLTDTQEHILSDQDIQLTSPQGRKSYLNTQRTIKVYDPKSCKIITLLTNNLSWTAQTISQLYLARWDIEVFFKHIKQQLKIKTFVITCPNAVLIQIWTAMIAILLLKYLQNKAKYPWHLSNLVAFLRIRVC